jgi:hypothetical protein
MANNDCYGSSNSINGPTVGGVILYIHTVMVHNKRYITKRYTVFHNGMFQNVTALQNGTWYKMVCYITVLLQSYAVTECYSVSKWYKTVITT